MGKVVFVILLMAAYGAVTFGGGVMLIAATNMPHILGFIIIPLLWGFGGWLFYYTENKGWFNESSVEPDDSWKIPNNPSGNPTGTSGESSEWYEDRYKKNWRGKK